jgi:raffinose/stachyose/melibiose transport system permease protein
MQKDSIVIVGKGQTKHSAAICSVLKYVFLALIVFISMAPLVWVVFSSFKTNSEILSSGLSLPSHWNLNGYFQAFQIAPLPMYFANSLLVAVVSTALNVFIMAMSSYVIARFDFKFKGVVVFLLSISLMIPMTALMNPVFAVVKSMGLYDTYGGLILVYTAIGIPMSMLILRSTFLGIPNSLEEAAEIDGAGFFRVFIQIAMPVAKSGIACAAVLQFLTCWNEFLFSLLLTSSESVRTLPLSLSYFTSQFSFNYTAMFAAIVISVIPSIVIFAVFQEQVVSSLTAGAVKG